jgi:hypothetical protein
MTGGGVVSASGVVDRPENELLLCCARTNRNLLSDDRISELVCEEIDWTYLLRTASRHRIAPLLFRSLDASYREAVPEDVMSWLQERFHANSRRNLLLTRDLFGILDALEERNIPAIPYKGPVLATVAYGNLALREFGDLDLLLDVEDVLKAKEVLISLGYRPRAQMTEAQEVAFLRYERQYEFARDDGAMVELQWKVTPGYFPFPLDHRYAWERTIPVSLGGRTVRTFSPEDLLLVLCVHGPVHCWGRLGLICDIAELVRASGDLDWERLVRRASALESKRMLLLGLFLANQLLDTNLDATVLREVRADATVEELAGEVRERLFSEEADSQGILEGTAFRGFHLRTIEGIQEKLRYCVHRAVTPTLWEWRLLPLPAAFFPFYHVLRPILLTGKLGLRLAQCLLRADTHTSIG